MTESARITAKQTQPAKTNHSSLDAREAMYEEIQQANAGIVAQPQSLQSTAVRLPYNFDTIPLHSKTPVGIQTKLVINTPGDEYEQEADAMADSIMRMPANHFIQRKCSKCEEEEKEKGLQRKESGNTVPNVSTSVNQTLQSPGQPLDISTRSFMEQRFAFDFSKVRIHNDPLAHQSAKEINALAYTHQHNIVFGSGQYQTQTESGRKLLAHELTHVIQQRFFSPQIQFLQRQPVAAPLTQAQLNQLCYESGTPQPQPSAMNPELHPTYAGWIGSFTGLTTFRSNDTVQGQTALSRFNVLGTKGRRFGDTSATTDTEAAPVTGRSMSGEEFIDHPTNEWVINCLPANLRATAYQLPADCADVAVILRHVWLSAHHRTETYNGWTVGDAAGSANLERSRQIIRKVSSGNVRSMVNPYADAQGNALTDFTVLQNLLHVGDVLVWEHREITRSRSRVSSKRTGGHTQTINQIIRNGANISDIKVLQGNQPIFSDAAIAILTSRGVRRPDAESSAGKALRDLPGRRIEASQAIGVEVDRSGVGIRVNNITNPETGASVWGEIDGQDEFTILIAAGPPRAASRPSASRSGGRRITDWRSRIQSANANSLSGVLEAMLQEARSIIEQGASAINQVTKPDMDALGQVYGTRLKAIFTRSADNLMQRVQEAVTVIRALGNDSTNSAVTGSLFNAFENTFVENALPQSTPEERRLFREHASLTNFTSPFATQISGFSTSLAAARNMTAARTVSEQHGTQLWQAATARTHAGLPGSNDDRPLYWSRLRMIESIRQTKMFFRISQTDRQQLIEIFENSSRGIPSSAGTSAFSTSTADKRILISGFDPFGLDSEIEDSNPSGATVLALDDQIISANNISAQIEGVIFPVRFRDFDQGMIENFFRPYIDGTHTVNMIMTISQGGSHFDIEKWAGRRRSDVFPDNEGAFSGGSPSNPVEPPGIASGPEFLETALPHRRMTPGTRARLNPRGRSEDPLTGQSITGTGGGFLSNEIFYRTRLLQTTIGGNALNIPIGHLHVPASMSRRRITNEIRQILQSALASI